MTPRKGGLLLGLLAVFTATPRLPSICQDTDPVVVLGHEILPTQHICVPPETPSVRALAPPA